VDEVCSPQAVAIKQTIASIVAKMDILLNLNLLFDLTFLDI
jgi:hypothetical protein